MENSTKVNEILIANGLDFRIEKKPLVSSEGDKTSYFGLFNSKSGECLNSVKESYTVSQNNEVVELVLKGMESFGSNLSVSKAGSLNGGRKVFLQLAIEGNSIVGNDVIKRYVTVIDSNDGSTSLSIGFGDICARCTNQFQKFYKQGDAKFRHTATMQQKLHTIPTLIELALSQSLKQMELYNKFVSTEVSRDLANKLVKHVLGFDRVYTSMDVLSSKSTQSINIMDKMYNDIETEFNQVGNNVWGLFGGITRFTTHNISTPKRDNARIESLLNGSGYAMNQKAMEFCLSEIQ